MAKRKWSLGVFTAGVFLAGFAFRGIVAMPAVQAQTATDKVFEIRIYTAPPGKLDALKARFRDQHDQGVRQVRDEEHRLLAASGVADAAAVGQHARVHPPASEPRSRDQGLGVILGGSRMGHLEDRVRERRTADGQGRIDFCDSDGVFGD